MNSRRAAGIISILAHPFMMVLILTISSAAASDNNVFGSVLLVILIVLIPLTIFITFKVRNKQWDNIDASNRTERPAFYLFAISLMILLAAFLYFTSFSQFMLKGSIGILFLFILHALLNRYIKASMHISFAVFTTVILLSLGISAGYITLVLLLLLIWARLKLKRHTLSEAAVGLIIGALSAVISNLL